MAEEGPIPGIDSYEIGAKIHRLRKTKDLSLVRLGDHTGMSAGLLSKIERGRLIPTLPTLLRIATVFGVGLDYFFVGDVGGPRVGVVRKKDRLRLPDRTDGQSPTFWFESLDFPVTDRKMDAYLAEFEPDAEATEPHSHAGAEMIYVVRGGLVVNILDEVISLDEGDSMYFDPSFPHSYCQSGKQNCCAVVVVAS